MQEPSHSSKNLWEFSAERQVIVLVKTLAFGLTVEGLLWSELQQIYLQFSLWESSGEGIIPPGSAV